MKRQKTVKQKQLLPQYFNDKYTSRFSLHLYPVLPHELDQNTSRGYEMPPGKKRKTWIIL
jgi:hypothetical protein